MGTPDPHVTASAQTGSWSSSSLTQAPTQLSRAMAVSLSIDRFESTASGRA